MPGFPARYIGYAGGLIALWLTARRRKPSPSGAASAEPGKARPTELLASALELQARLRQALLEPPDSGEAVVAEELQREVTRFRTAVRAAFQQSALARDPRARHFALKVSDALPREPPSLDPGAAAPEPLWNLDDPKLRLRMHAAHEAALDLIEFLQAELGSSRRLAVFDLSIDPELVARAGPGSPPASDAVDGGTDRPPPGGATAEP